MGWRRVGTKAGIGLTDADSRIDTKDIWEVGQSLAPEVSQPCIVRPELCLQTFPGNQGRLLEIAHPVGKPHVEVDGEGRPSQMTDRAQVNRDGRAGDLVEEVLAQYDLRWPGWSLREQSSQRLQPRSSAQSDVRRTRRSRSEVQRGLPLELHVLEATKLLLEPSSRARGPLIVDRPSLRARSLGVEPRSI